MNNIQLIKSTVSRTLYIILDDTEIITYKLGSFNGIEWYSQVIWGPSDGLVPSYTGYILNENECILSINETLKDITLDKSWVFNINYFFDKDVWKI